MPRIYARLYGIPSHQSCLLLDAVSFSGNAPQFTNAKENLFCGRRLLQELLPTINMYIILTLACDVQPPALFSRAKRLLLLSISVEVLNVDKSTFLAVKKCEMVHRCKFTVFIFHMQKRRLEVFML